MDKQPTESAICHFLSDIYGVTLLVFDRTGSLVERHSSTAESAEYLLSFLNFQARLLGLCGQTRRTQVLSNELSQVWAGIPVLHDNHLQKVIVAGPVFTSEESKSGVIDFAYSYDIAQWKNT